MTTFDFQRFSVLQAESGMKVCTDATLFGAMAPLAGGETVLDIGCGTGLLALMAAQLGAARVIAVDISAVAVAEAQANFAASPWPDRLSAVHQDICRFAPPSPVGFDLVICNPPFFPDHTRSSDPARRLARHSDSLAMADLVAAVARLLNPGGLFHVLIPRFLCDELERLCHVQGLFPICRTDLRAYVHSQAKLAAVTLSHTPAEALVRTLMIYSAARVYTAQSAHYLRPFLLRFGAKS